MVPLLINGNEFHQDEEGPLIHPPYSPPSRLRPWRNMSCLATLAICSITSPCWANEDFFALPSPSEILADAESEGLTANLSRSSLSVLSVDLKSLAQKDPIRACYDMGRIFSVSGHGFKQLNNKVILQLAKKVLGGVQSLALPEVISKEIDQFYNLMTSKNSWDRNELLLSFTTARASLMYLLKDSGKVPEKDQVRLDNYGVALECGMWYQSLSLAIENIKENEKQLEAFQSVYLDPDYLDYFKRILNRPLSNGHEVLFEKFKKVNDLCLKAISDSKLQQSDIVAIRQALAEVTE